MTELVTLRDENADIRRRLLEGALMPNVAAVAIQSINTDIRAVGVALRVREQEELVGRIQDIEAAQEAQEQARANRFGY
jgi:negative regulator of replication initiation